MLKIRLVRMGKRNHPFYRVVAIDSKSKRGGKPAETLGFWNPSLKEVKIDKDKIKAWKGKGAIISAAVEKLL